MPEHDGVPAFVILDDRDEDLTVTLGDVEDALQAADDRIHAMTESLGDDVHGSEVRRSGIKDAAMVYRRAVEETLADEFQPTDE